MPSFTACVHGFAAPAKNEAWPCPTLPDFSLSSALSGADFLGGPAGETDIRPGIFGVPLRQSITYANVAISLVDENGQSYIYGYVPIVVAKCGVFLKEKGESSTAPPPGRPNAP